MARKAVIEIDLGKYKSIELSLEDAERLLAKVTEKLGFESNDVNETYRILRNFEAFYETMKKKFKDYLVPSKSMNDMILGRVVVDKVKLVKEGGERRVVISFDRRVPVDVIVEALREIGFDEVIVKQYKLEEASA